MEFRHKRLLYFLIGGALLALIGLALLFLRPFKSLDALIDWIEPGNITRIKSVLSITAALGFGILVAIARFASVKPFSSKQNPLRAWGAGFLICLVGLGSLIIYVNPRGYYGSRHFTLRLQTTHQDKVIEYPVLSNPPDIVVLGSSRARTLNNDYSQSMLGYTLYNAAVSGGGILDSTSFARFMAAQSARTFPKVLLVDMSPGELRRVSGRSSSWPLTMIPYMDVDMLSYAIRDRFKGPVSLAELSESVTTLLVNTRKPVVNWSFGPDGSGDAPLISPQQLESALDLVIAEEYQIAWCDQVDPGFITNLDEIINIVDQHRTAAVFYWSPREPRFYQEAMLDNPTYAPCVQVYREFFDTLTQAHDNVFFVDLIDPQKLPLESTPQYFYDQQHITRKTANLLLDAMAATLKEAYETAQTSSVIS